MTSTNIPEAAGGPWTRHGHAVAGVTVAGPKPPNMAVARCGGPGVCPGCSVDAQRMLTSGAGDPR